MPEDKRSIRMRRGRCQHQPLAVLAYQSNAGGIPCLHTSAARQTMGVMPNIGREGLVWLHFGGGSVKHLGNNLHDILGWGYGLVYTKRNGNQQT